MKAYKIEDISANGVVVEFTDEDFVGRYNIGFPNDADLHSYVMANWPRNPANVSETLKNSLKAMKGDEKTVTQGEIDAADPGTVPRRKAPPKSSANSVPGIRDELDAIRQALIDTGILSE